MRHTSCQQPRHRARRQSRTAQAIRVWRDFTPMAPAEMAALRARTAERARGGALEGYKTGINFDGTVKNPHWLTTASVAA